MKHQPWSTRQRVTVGGAVLLTCVVLLLAPAACRDPIGGLLHVTTDLTILTRMHDATPTPTPTGLPWWLGG